MKFATRYTIAGVVVGLFAPASLLAYGTIGGRSFDPVELFVVMALGGVSMFALAGQMIGRRDDVLDARNRDLAELSARFRELSTTDGLMNIPNRRAFDERLAMELARSVRYGAPLSLVIVDLDHFKDLNDRHGHLAGDEVLRRTAAVLDSEKRIGDMVARYGGEELVALLPHTEAASALAWAERVRVHLAAERIAWEGTALSVTASFGVAAVPGNGTRATDLVEAADGALYQAKRMGRNRSAAASPRRLTPAGSAAQS